jgi:hypothetical protein
MNAWNTLSSRIPDYAKPWLKRVFYLPAELVESVTGREPMVPPRSLNFAGGGRL